MKPVNNDATNIANGIASGTAPADLSKTRAVIVTTSHRGVFFGYLAPEADDEAEILHLTGARMAIYWGTTRGIMQLAETGPTSTSKISSRADLQVRSITAVMTVTEEAVKAWEAA